MDVETTPGAEEGPRIWRNAAIGAASGFVAVVAGVTAAGTAGGMGAGNALALGSFVGLWGGLGFGFMMGGCVPLSRYLDTVSARPTTAATTDA